MSMEDGNSGAASAADALQMSLQEEKTGTQSDMNEVFENQSFVASVVYTIPGVDPNDPTVKNLLAVLNGQRENVCTRNVQGL
ncbi:26S proteasome non-ATPase regulatory subunit 4 homolog [Phragmites australis]|uniref:26S proteasome non-ATPase regulatory subunit 4 homolog n=1 Tax=Phragmites australis TaxID=29695 RepID=UPI002D767902|nr:26S proteasome non-ATPase regulatory subunit 4 homolog [Phragmites australis]